MDLSAILGGLCAVALGIPAILKYYIDHPRDTRVDQNKK